MDYAAYAIKSRDRLKKIVNFNYYFKSIIENCLTPGFDVFGVPKVAHAMRYITYNLPDPSHNDIRKVYQADMITLYGEYYILFGGYAALAALFISAFFIRAVFSLVKDRNIYFYYLKRSIILYIFYIWLMDFGIDWLIFDFITIVIMFVLFKMLYRLAGNGLRKIIET